MFASLTDAQWVGFSFVLLGIALMCGMLVRRAVPFLAAVYIPTSVLAGFLILLAGPLIPDQIVPVLSALPGLMINIVFAGIGLGLATISMLTGVIGGTVLVNWAVRNPRIDVARRHTTARSTVSVMALLWLGPRFFPEHWFDHAITDYGQSQGNVATGFILAEMADPAHTTTAAVGYGYKQLFCEPFLGGGILTALSVPLIISIGSLAFGIASAVITAGLIIWGVRRCR